MTAPRQITLAAVALGAAGIVAWLIVPWNALGNAGWYAAAAGIGLLVGSTELLQRYRDAPFRALCCTPALAYVSVNALASLAALAIAMASGWEFGATAKNLALTQTLVCGFGAMVVFRSALFNIKIDQREIGVGPAVFFQVLLFATDREVDRRRALDRADAVERIMAGVSWQLAKENLRGFCFELMQNVPDDEANQIDKAVEGLDKDHEGMQDGVKVLNLGLMLMEVVGEPVLEAAVRKLGGRIQSPSKLSLEVLAALQQINFTVARTLLVEVCFLTARALSPTERDAARQAVRDEVATIAADPAGSNLLRMTLLATSLERRVGNAVLLASLLQIADEARLPPDPPPAPVSPAPPPPPPLPAPPPPP